MADEWQKYVNDERSVCKYGPKCYQKNAEHHKNFKHPPTLNKKDKTHKNNRYSPYTRDTRGYSPGTSNKIINKDAKTENDSSKSIKIAENDLEEIYCINIPQNLTYLEKDTDRSIFKDLFLVEMPNDFFNFFEFINVIGESAEKSLAAVNLELIGPYDLLLGKLPVLENKELYLIHWRFFYDPPEFQAVLKKKNSEYHIGYYRDDPAERPAFLASNNCNKDYHISIMSENIFGAVYLYLQNEKKTSLFSAMPCQKLMEKIKTYAEEKDISLEPFNAKKRLSHIVTKTFHGAGIVVPYNKKTQLGYRRLAETDANLKKLFTNLQNAKSQEEKDKILSDLQVVITYASIAVDECDFGTGLELGINLFCSGLKELQSVALSNLLTAYSLLNRKPFGQIAEAHLKCRRKGSKMSLLS